MTVKNNKNKGSTELLKKIRNEHRLFLDELAELEEEQKRFLKKYRKKLEDLKISELRKKLK